MINICLSCPNTFEGHTPSLRSQIPIPSSGYHMSRGGRMKYFKFIIYFQLFAAAAMHLFAAIYQTDVLNTYFDVQTASIKNLQISYAIISILLAIFALVIRWRLASFKAYAPALYVCYILANAVIAFFYLVWLGLILKVHHYDISLVNSYLLTLLAGFCVVFFNYVYFTKREPLFSR